MLRVVVIGHNQALYKEVDAAEAITPGHVIDLNSSGKAIKNTTTGLGKNRQGVLVAVENDMFGKGIDDAYALNDRVIYQPLDRGCEFMALVAAGAAAIVYGDPIDLVSGGTVKKATDYTTAIGRAVAALDNSGGATPARLRVEII